MGLKSFLEATNILRTDEKIELIIHLIGECESELPNTYAGDKEFEDYVRDLDDIARDWKSYREKRQLLLVRNEIEYEEVM